MPTNLSKQFFSKENLTKQFLGTDNLKSYGLIILGCFIMAVGFVVFTAPLKLAPGGVYGIATILHYLFDFSIGITGFCLDVPLLLIGTAILGPQFGAKTILGIVSLSASITILENTYGIHLLIDDPSTFFVQAIFGGILLGIGVGCIFKTKATSGGTDIIATIVKKYIHVSIGTALIIVDSIVVIFALVVFNDWTIPLYSLIVIYITGFVADMVVKGFNPTKTVFVISEKNEEIAKMIIKELERGATYLQGKGAYSGNDKHILFTNINIREVATLRKFIREIDPNAFVTIMDATEVIGDGFTSIHEKY